MPIIIAIITYFSLNFEADIKDDILMRANLAIFAGIFLSIPALIYIPVSIFNVLYEFRCRNNENIFISKEILKMIEERSPVEIGVVNVPAYDE